MTPRAIPLILLVATIAFSGARVVPAWAEGGDDAALAAAMKDATATLQGGLKASEAQGTPISAKFELEDGKLQLSVYTMKGNDFVEVVADPNTGAIAKSENGCRGFKRGGRAEGRDGKGEGPVADRDRDSGEGKCRLPGR